MGKIWAVCSGVGGAGKSTVALSLAVGAAKHGKQTILLDASGISRSCDLILGLEGIVVLDMLDVIQNQVSLESAIYAVPRYDRLRFACASLYDSIPATELTGVILALQTLCDVLVIDLPTGAAGIGQALQSGDERILVVRPDDIAIRATQRMCSALPADHATISLVVNRIIRERGRRRTQYDADTVRNLLDSPVLGCIPEDPSIPDSEKQGRAAIECSGPAWSVFRSMVDSLLASAS